MKDDGFDIHTQNEQIGRLKQQFYQSSAFLRDPDLRVSNLHSGSDKIFKLDSVQKTQFERAFDTDLEDVRIHIGPYADDITRNAHADAVTIGRDIYFHAGKYSPDTEEGRNLLAHELRHFIHFKEDKRMVYREDIEELEDQAMAAEMMMANISIQHVSAPHLSQDSKPPEGSRDNEATNDSSVRFEDAPKTLHSFGEKRDKPLYRIYFPSTGKVYILTNEEKEKAIESAIVKYKKYINSKAALLPEDEQERYILMHLAFLYCEA